jgi:hypothetical protein
MRNFEGVSLWKRNLLGFGSGRGNMFRRSGVCFLWRAGVGRGTRLRGDKGVFLTTSSAPIQSFILAYTTDETVSRNESITLLRPFVPGRPQPLSKFVSTEKQTANPSRFLPLGLGRIWRLWRHVPSLVFPGSTNNCSSRELSKLMTPALPTFLPMHPFRLPVFLSGV